MNLPEAFVTVRAKLPNHEGILKRLDRAYDILRMPGYEISKVDGDLTYTVEKLSTSLMTDESASYKTSLDGCTCPDWSTAPAQLCKHVLAITLLETMHGES